MNIRNEILLQNNIVKKEKFDKKKLARARNHILFNNHKYIQFLDLTNSIIPFLSNGIYCLYNKRLYKLKYARAYHGFTFGWIDIFDSRCINTKILSLNKKEYADLDIFLISKDNKYRSGYVFTASSINQIIKLMYDIKINNAKHYRLNNIELKHACDQKLISKQMYNRFRKNNLILGFTDEIQYKTIDF